MARKFILEAGLPVVSVSLKPIEFGENYVLENRFRSYPTQVDQIILALEKSTAEYVFFCEHDVLYHKSHFDYTPTDDNTFYYNINNFRWDFPNDRAIQYDGLTSLSQLCVNRKKALDHYKQRQAKIKEWDLDIQRSREPRHARVWGYEPGTKKTRNGGFSDELCERWRSEFPNVDIRHDKTFSKPKITLSSFHHKPENWKEITLNQIDGWDLKELFNLKL